MTAKDFILLAEEIRTCGYSDENKRAAAQIIIRAARRSNGRFKEHAFLKACDLDLK